MVVLTQHKANRHAAAMVKKATHKARPNKHAESKGSTEVNAMKGANHSVVGAFFFLDV